MKIGFQELIIVLVVALIVLGPDKMPYYARKLGEALKQFRKYSSEATKDIREGIVEPLQEAQKPLKEALEPVTDLQKTVKNEMNDLKRSLTGTGTVRTPKEEPVAEVPAGEAEAGKQAGEEPAAESTQEVPADAAKDIQAEMIPGQDPLTPDSAQTSSPEGEHSVEDHDTKEV